MAFPVEAYISAKKWQEEQKAANDPGAKMASGLGQGVGAGIMGAFTEKADMKKKRYDAFGNFLKSNMLFNSETGEQLNLDEIMREQENFSQGGKISPNIKTKSMGTAYQFNPSTGQYEPTNIGTGTGKTTFLAPVKKESNPEAEMDTYNRKQLFKGQPKAKKELISNVTESNVLRSTIAEAIEAAKNIPTGWGGALKLKGKELVGSNDPVLSDLQTVKNALGKLQLMNLQFTKGAVSDAEMKFFAETVGNGDVKSLPRMITSFQRALKDIDMREQSAKDAYSSTYEEDPDSFLRVTKKGGGMGSPANGGPGGIPRVGDSFQGGKVISIKRIK